MARTELIGEFDRERALDILSILCRGRYGFQGSCLCLCGHWHKIETLSMLASSSKIVEVYYISEGRCGISTGGPYSKNISGRIKVALSTKIIKLKIEEVEGL